jgi:acyl carrier protein
MDRGTTLDLLRACIAEIAPETDVQALDPARALRRQVDLDSADWLNFLVAVHERSDVDIADAQAARLITLDQIADFVVQRAA